jgi:hypothetical protein
MVPVPIWHYALIHIAIALVTWRRGLRLHRHRRLQWEDTQEKGQYNLLCENTTRSDLSYSHATSICLLLSFNYLRHVRFSSWPLYYSCLVEILTCHFMCCACSIMYCITLLVCNSIMLACLITAEMSRVDFMCHERLIYSQSWHGLCKERTNVWVVQ